MVLFKTAVQFNHLHTGNGTLDAFVAVLSSRSVNRLLERIVCQQTEAYRLVIVE